MASKTPIEIKEMPDKSLLAEFLEGLSGWVSVIFNSETGRFERVRPADNAQEAGSTGAGSPPAGGYRHVP